MVLDSFLMNSGYEYICVPDCAGVICVEEESNFTTDCSSATWSLTFQQCGCYSNTPGVTNENENSEMNSEHFLACGCPQGYAQNQEPCDVLVETCNKFDFDSSLPCVILDVDTTRCFDLDVDFSFAPFTCNSMSASDTVRITITGADNSPLMEGDVVKIQDLINCNLITNDNALVIIQDSIPGVDAAFVADTNGEILIEFLRDPKDSSKIELGMQTIIIPSCAITSLSAEDPCTCSNPNNILAPDGTILFWADTLKITGAVDSMIVLTENIDSGFLNPISEPYLPFSTSSGHNVLGTIGALGKLNIPFYRKAGESAGATTDITFGYPTNSSAVGFSIEFQRECNLGNTDCLVPNPIPTLGQWSKIILGLLLLIFGIVGFKVVQLKNYV
jgi:hypothetical protein